MKTISNNKSLSPSSLLVRMNLAADALKKKLDNGKLPVLELHTRDEEYAHAVAAALGYLALAAAGDKQMSLVEALNQENDIFSYSVEDHPYDSKLYTLKVEFGKKCFEQGNDTALKRMDDATAGIMKKWNITENHPEEAFFTKFLKKKAPKKNEHFGIASVGNSIVNSAIIVGMSENTHKQAATGSPVKNREAELKEMFAEYHGHLETVPECNKKDPAYFGFNTHYSRADAYFFKNAKETRSPANGNGENGHTEKVRKKKPPQRREKPVAHDNGANGQEHDADHIEKPFKPYELDETLEAKLKNLEQHNFAQPISAQRVGALSKAIRDMSEKLDKNNPEQEKLGDLLLNHHMAIAATVALDVGEAYLGAKPSNTILNEVKKSASQLLGYLRDNETARESLIEIGQDTPEIALILLAAQQGSTIGQRQTTFDSPIKRFLSAPTQKQGEAFQAIVENLASPAASR